MFGLGGKEDDTVDFSTLPDPVEMYTSVGAKEPQSSNPIRRLVADPLVGLAKGAAVGIPETVVGLLDIPTMGHAGKVAETVSRGLGLGDFKSANEMFDNLLTPETREAQQKVAEAKGFLPTIATAIQNPSSIVQTVAESIPAMVTGMRVAGGIAKLAGKPLVEAGVANLPRIAKVGGIAEGAITAGQNIEQTRQQTEEGLLTPSQVAINTLSGVLTGMIGVAGGRLAQRFGLEDVDTLFTGGRSGIVGDKEKGIFKKILMGAFQEGVLEELPQSMQEQIAQNLALNKPIDDGVFEAGAMGMLAGFAQSTGANIAGSTMQKMKNELDPINQTIKKLVDETLPGELNAIGGWDNGKPAENLTPTAVSETPHILQPSDINYGEEIYIPPPAPTEPPPESFSTGLQGMARELNIGQPAQLTPEEVMVTTSAPVAPENIPAPEQKVEAPTPQNIFSRMPDDQLKSMADYGVQGAKDEIIRRTETQLNTLPAPLSQTDAATVGVTKDEAKSGESLKEPWQQTQKEYEGALEEKAREESQQEDYILESIEKGIPTGLIAKELGITEKQVNDIYGRITEDDVADIDQSIPAAEHKAFVEAALREGKPVPESVLKDYPELAKGNKAQEGKKAKPPITNQEQLKQRLAEGKRLAAEKRAEVASKPITPAKTNAATFGEYARELGYDFPVEVEKTAGYPTVKFKELNKKLLKKNNTSFEQLYAGFKASKTLSKEVSNETQTQTLLTKTKHGDIHPDDTWGGYDKNFNDTVRQSWKNKLEDFENDRKRTIQENGDTKTPRDTSYRGENEVSLRRRLRDRRFLDEEMRGADQRNDKQRWQGVKISPTLADTTEFKLAEKHFADLGYQTVPITKVPWGMAVNSVTKVVFMGEMSGDRFAYFMAHETTHILSEQGNPSIQAIKNAVDLTNPAVAEQQKNYGWTDDYTRDEFAAAIVGGIAGSESVLKSNQDDNIKAAREATGNRIKPAMETKKPTFYSQLEKVVTEKLTEMPSKIQSIPKWLERQGVKPAEMKWMGVEQWLRENAKDGRIDKQKFADFLKENQIEIREVTKGEVSGGRIGRLLSDELRKAGFNIAMKTNGTFNLYRNTELIESASDAGEYKEQIQKFFEDTDTLERQGETKFSSYQLPGGPLSRDTEILTTIGWKRMDAIQIGDTVLSRKDDNGTLEWVPVEDTPSVYSKNLYHFKSQSVDMMVSPCHQMIVEKRIGDSKHRRRQLIRIAAEELWNTWDCRIPLSGNIQDRKAEKLFGLDAGDVAEFVGWYLSEGSYKQKNGHKNTIQISQSKTTNQEKCRRLEKLFDRLSFTWKYYDSSHGGCYGIHIKTMPVALKLLLHEQPTSEKKYIPKLFFMQPMGVINRLLTGMILGDGCTTPQRGTRKSRTIYATNSKQLADDFQALIIFTGKRGKITQRKTGLYIVDINTKKWATVDDAKKGIIPYNDRAYCVTVKNHAIYVRRNGTAAFTGNSNYKELLMILPPNEKAKQSEGVLSPKEQFDITPKTGKDLYRSAHWDEPNVLAHVRMNGRTDAEGNKVLFLEEVQSDWHQEGKKKGYASGQSLNRIDEIREQMDQLIKGPYDKGGMIYGDNRIKYDELNKEFKQLLKEKDAVLPAPFAENWHEMVMKRMLRYAAENGYDKIAWTTGEQQAERYDLSKHLDRIEYEAIYDEESGNKNDHYEIIAYDKNGVKVIREDEISIQRVEELVGKDIATKIQKGEGVPRENSPYREWKSLSGLDLKVGGEGMKSFYDNLIPGFMNRYVKQWGAKVGESKVNSTTNLNAPQRYVGPGYTVDELINLIKTSPNVSVERQIWAIKEEMDDGYSFQDAANRTSPATAKHLGGNIEYDKKMESVHSIPITPAMRESVMQGQPMYGDIKPLDYISSYIPDSLSSWFKQTSTNSIPSSDISQANGTWETPASSTMNTLNYVLADRNIDLRDVTKSIEKTHGILTDQKNASLAETLFSGRLSSRIDDFVNNELHAVTKAMAESKVSIAQIEEYVHARHAEEANNYLDSLPEDERKGDAGISTEDANAYLQSLDPTLKEKYEKIALMLDKITHKNAQLLVDYGLESQETIDKWFSKYKHYVPLFREDIEERPGTGQGFTVAGSASKGRTGSERKVVHILSNIAMQRERTLTRGEKNRVSQSLVSLAENFPNEDFWKVIKIPRLSTFIAEGVEARIKPNVVVARVKDEKTGEIKHIGVQFNEKNERAVRMASALKNMDMDTMGEILGNLGKITRYVSAINTQYNPVFGVTNFFRDMGTAAFNLSTTPIAGKQKAVLSNVLPAMKGIWQATNNDESSEMAKMFKDFQLHGGQTGYRNLFVVSEDRAKDIERELKSLQAGKPRRYLSAFAKILSDYNTMSENAIRLSAYKVGIESGMTKDQAASMAKNLTVNFNKKGQIAGQAGALYAFFNASVQGAVRMYETIKGPMGRKIIAGGIILGATQAMMLAAAGFKDEEPPEFVKERNIIIPIGGKKYITFPMPLGFNVIPNVGRILAEITLGGGKNAGVKMSNLIGVITETFNPMGSSGLSMQTVAPTFLDPFAALAENKDWTGRPIYKEDFNALNPTPGTSRVKDSATVFGRGLAWAFNILTGGDKYTPGMFSPTPDQIDYLGGQITGGLGREIGKTSMMFESLYTGNELPTYRLPLTGRFYGSAEGQANESSKYYSNLKKLNIHEENIKGRIKDREPVGEYIRDNPEAKLWRMANTIENTIGKIKKRKEIARTPEAKKTYDKLITIQQKRLNDMMERVGG